MKSPLARNLLKIGAAFLALAIILVVIVWIQFRNLPKPDFLRLPPPNGYELLVTAANQFQVNIWDVTNEFAAFVHRHERVFADLDAALNEPAEAPERAYNPEYMLMQDLMALKRLSHALEIQAKQLRAEGSWLRAAEKRLDAMQLGQKVERGPLISFMVGSAIELGALQHLEESLPSLRSDQLVEISGRLRELNASRMSMDEVVRRERYFMAVNATNVLESLRHRFSTSLKNIIAAAEERYLNTTAQTEILATTMAALAYSLEEKQLPTALSDLVPEYLPAVPLDPYTHSPLLVQFSATNLLVYSTGPNRQDDAATKDDLTLDDEDTTGYRMMAEALSNMF